MRRNLALVEALRQAGVDFVPMPVLSLEDKAHLAKEAHDRALAALIVGAVLDAASEE
uniref:DUF1382 family protein n=1 Tax=Vibrio cholerae TaxID=666 RepID=UPI000B17B43F